MNSSGDRSEKMFTPKTALPLTARSCALRASISIKDFLNVSYFSFSSPVDEYCPNVKRDVERQTFALQISCRVVSDSFKHIIAITYHALGLRYVFLKELQLLVIGQTVVMQASNFGQ